MRFVKWFLWVVLASVVFGFLHYTLPQRDIVRITGTYNRLTEVGANSIFYASPDSGTTTATVDRRDIRFIEAVFPDGGVMVYRNEDTGWIWPPYFKYDSSNLHAQATDLISTKTDPQWVSVTSYGWRVAWLSIYPNAISVRPVASENDRPFNWPAQIILLLMGAFLFLIWRMWNQFRERAIDPAAKKVSDAVDRADARVDAAMERASTELTEARDGFTGWLDTWKGKPRDPK